MTFRPSGRTLEIAEILSAGSSSLTVEKTAITADSGLTSLGTPPSCLMRRKKVSVSTLRGGRSLESVAAIGLSSFHSLAILSSSKAASIFSADSVVIKSRSARKTTIVMSLAS